jgi:hypothetical protein
MGNNQNQIIKQALEILSENNRFALKSITNDAAIKRNFYKLSGEPELRDELKEDLKKSDGPVVVFDKDPESPKPDDPKSKNKSKDKPRRPLKKTFYEKLKEWSDRKQIDAIMDLYGVDVTGWTPEEIAKLLKANYSPGSDMPSSRILNTNLGRDK